MADETKKDGKPETAAKPTPRRRPARRARNHGRGPEDGRWRGGLNFGPIDVVVDLSTITVAQLAAIEGDPLLSVKRS